MAPNFHSIPPGDLYPFDCVPRKMASILKSLDKMQSDKAPTRKLVRSVGHALNAPMPGVQHHCFGCSTENKHGLRLRFQENLQDGSVGCEFLMPRRFEGPPGHLHGGIIATVLDEAMGKVNRQKGIVALTRRMTIDYLRPVPLGVKLRAVGWPVSAEGRKHFHAGEIRTLEGEVLARSEGLFIAVDPVEMFRKYGTAPLKAGKTKSVETAKLVS